MSFPFTDDHEMIRDAVRSFLQDWYDGGKGPERMANSGLGYDPLAWASFAKELGMAGIAIGEAYGGAGMGDLGRVVVMEELGASLCAMPFSPSATIAVDMLTAFGDEAAQKTYLPQLACGELIAAYTDGHSLFSNEDDLLNGSIRDVLFAEQADILLISMSQGSGRALYAVPQKTDGVIISGVKTMDPTRGFSDVEFVGVKLSDLEKLGEGPSSAFNDIVKTSFIGLAAECVGGAQKCLDMTLEYAAQRVQFGRPISSFQAIKHRCADMYVMLEAARSATYAAALAEEDEKVEAALIAKAYASDAFFKIAGDALQLHGGIGFTWEYPLHYFFKRARANKAVFGSSSQAYNALADQLFEGAA